MTDRQQMPLTPHKAVLLVELLHAIVVVIVVMASTMVFVLDPTIAPGDLLGFVYGGALSYAGVSASQARGALRRQSDPADTQ